ncbi:MAG: ATP-binding protein [Flavobacteriales bacterium]|nr:ATP-binding protein [Flavobacteriales bacterium]
MLDSKGISKQQQLETHIQLIEYFTQSIYRSNSIEDILWDICNNCVQKLNFVDCVVYLVDKKSNDLVQRAAFGEKVAVEPALKDPIRMRFGQGIVGSVAEKGEFEIIPDTSSDERYIVDDGVRLSELAVPIIFENKVIGVIDSEHPEKDFFNSCQARVLTNIAAICAHKIAWFESKQQNEIAINFHQANPNPALRINVMGDVLDYNAASLEILNVMKWDGKVIRCLNCLKSIRDVVHYGNRVFFLESESTSWKVFCESVENKSYVYIFATEVTELIQARKDAEAARIEKAKFLSSMSHEIRTPLHAIISLTDLLNSTLLNKKQEEYLEMLKFSGKNLLALVNDILEFERLELSAIEIDEMGFQLDSTLQMLIDSFKILAEEKGIYLESNIHAISNFFIRSDEQKLTQILTNLLGNAIKFTDRGGVRLDAEIEPNEDGSVRITFAITDSGVGIPASQISEIFEVFKMVHADSRKRGGTGLGLAICKRLSEYLGGQLSVESTEGKGSKFTFSFDAELVSPNCTVDETTEQKNQLINKKVLVVDDNKVNLIVACTFLRQWGAIPTEADSGFAALELLEKNQFDVVLMDIQMPRMDGIETTQKYFSNPDNPIVPIVGLTADVFANTREAALAAGMIDLITKPFNPRSLEATLLNLVGDQKE